MVSTLGLLRFHSIEVPRDARRLGPGCSSACYARWIFSAYSRCEPGQFIEDTGPDETVRLSDGLPEEVGWPSHYGPLVETT
jgi:hypothetical protein